jgi:exopolysaccharide biosynthesis polyprenyl glycosylphosphotransferase
VNDDESGRRTLNPAGRDRDKDPTRQGQSLLKRNWRPFYILLNIAVDSGTIIMAGIAAYAIRQMIVTVPLMTIANVAVVVLTSCAVAIATALLCGLYRSAYRIPFSEQYREAGQSFVYSAVAIVFAMCISLGRDFPPRFIALFLFLIPVFFVAGRTAINGANLYLQKKGYGRHNTMIINWDSTAANLPDRFAMFPELGYNVRAFACSRSGTRPCDPQTCVLQRGFAQVRMFRKEPKEETLPCYELDNLERGIEEEQIERLFVSMIKPVADGFSEIVRVCMEKKVKLKVISRESEELLRFSRVKDIAGISLYSPPKLFTNRLKARVKRVFDICGSLLLLVLFSPFFALVTLTILIEDGRPVFFHQRRASMKGGRSFDFLKFRSMTKGAETEQKALNGLNQTEGGLFLLKKDPRVTKMGRWIRKFSLDELPQLLNVFKGEMSLVGPRPLSMIDLENASPDNDFAGYYYLRDNTRPGITGLWQICGRREVPFREMMLLDLYYIENQSVIFDLEILFATIPVVLFGKGAY